MSYNLTTVNLEYYIINLKKIIFTLLLSWLLTCLQIIFLDSNSMITTHNHYYNTLQLRTDL